MYIRIFLTRFRLVTGSPPDVDHKLSEIMKNIQAMRILILVAIASQTAAFIFSIFGLNCTSIGLQRPDLKYRLVRRKSDKDTFFNCCIQNIVSLIFHLISLISISIGTILFTVALMKNSDQSDQYQVFYF